MKVRFYGTVDKHNYLVVYRNLVNSNGSFHHPVAFGYMPYVVLSGSMEPVYPVGSLIYVAPVDANSLEPGDAITFDRNDAVVTH